MKDLTALRKRNQRRKENPQEVHNKVDENTGLQLFPESHQNSQAVQDIFTTWVRNFNARNGHLPDEHIVQKLVEKTVRDPDNPHKDAWRLSYSIACEDEEELEIANKLVKTAHQIAGHDEKFRKNEQKQGIYQARRIKMWHSRLKGSRQDVDTPSYFLPAPTAVADEYCKWLIKCCQDWRYCSVWAISIDNKTWSKFENYLDQKVLPRGLEKE